MKKKHLHLFEAYGIELEYMIVQKESLEPLFICDQILEGLAGFKTMNIEDGAIAWSNELALHVIEIKCNGPQENLSQVKKEMATAIRKMNAHLSKYDAILLPTAMHPFFNPQDGSLKLWAGEDKQIYSAYDRIFGCQGHGWGNLQSIHINLPFCGDDEFFKLHTAIRFLLPLLPAVAASSPFVEGKKGPWDDSRLHFYLQNQRRIPSIIGDGIPEPVRSKKEYQEKILRPMYKDISSVDTDGILQNEWLNSRAAIARFERHAIEIRILDIQESVQADFFLIEGIVAILKYLVHRDDIEALTQVPQAELKQILLGSLSEGKTFRIPSKSYAHLLGDPQSIGDALQNLLSAAGCGVHIQKKWLSPNLAERLRQNLTDSPSRSEMVDEYQKLTRCLDEDILY